MPIRDWAQRQGLVGSPDRPMSWRQRLDWIIPGNVYRHNEGTGWSRNDWIGAWIQFGTGLPVAGLVSRMLGGRNGDPGAAGPAQPRPSQIGPPVPGVQPRASEVGPFTPTEQWLRENGYTEEEIAFMRQMNADRNRDGRGGAGRGGVGAGNIRGGSPFGNQASVRGLGLGIRGDALGQAIEEMSARQHSRGGLLQER